MLERSTTADSSTDYDNLSTSTFTDNEDLDRTLNTQQLCNQCTSKCRCANATPTASDMNNQLNDNNRKHNMKDGGTISAISKEILKLRFARQKRSYRIIDNYESQRLLQQIASEKLAEMQSARKSSKHSKRRSSNIKNSPSFLLYKQEKAYLWKSENDFSKISLSSKRHPEVTRAASFGQATVYGLHKNTGESKLSQPVNIFLSSVKKIADRDKNSEMNFEHVEMTTTVRESLPLPANQSRISDEDIGSMQRLSFVSSSTGYSSARSSLRSSEIGEDSFLSKTSDLTIERRIIARESLLSEARRLKLMKKSNISQLDRIAMELLETERCYVNDLSDIIQGYLNFFIGHREHFQMTVDDVSNTFGCIERIYLFNKRLFYQLDRALLNVVQMAKCFVENIEGFKDYVTYCANYQKMVDTLSTLMKNNSVVECLSARQTLLNHSLPLSAYLLKPVQRVLKYHLFMENILKQSTETRNLSDADLGIVKKALQCLTTLADKINEEKKRVEHWERVRELQSALHSWSLDKRDDLFKYGDLVLEGTFKLAGSKSNRQLFLFEEMLLIVKERNDTLICKDYIMCSSIMLNESVGPDPLAFQVMSYDNPKIQYIFVASNLEQKRKWMKELKKMMLDHYDIQIPEKVKLLMLNANNVSSNQLPISGVSVHETTQSHKNRKVPKYLEKKRKMRDIGTPKSTLHKNHGIRSSKTAIKPAPANEVLLCSRTDMNSSHHALNCTCSINGVQQKPDFPAKDCPSGLHHLEQPCCTSTSFFSNFFQKRKPIELFNTKNGTSERKDGVAHSSLIPHHSSPCEDIGSNSSKCEGELLRCTCSRLDPIVSPISYSAKFSASSLSNKSENDCSFFRELNEPLNHAEMTNMLFDKKLPQDQRVSLLEPSMGGKHSKEERGRETGNSNRALYFPKAGLTGSGDQRRRRSKSLSRLDDAHCSSPMCGSPLNAHNRSRHFLVNSTEDDPAMFVNGSVFGKYLDEATRGRLQESEREDEEEDVANAINWTESPVVRERIKARKNSEQLFSHRRRSSQVAELVWRLKQKQDLKKQSNNDRSEKLSAGFGAQSNSISSEMFHSISNDLNLLCVANDSSNGNALISSARQRTPLTVEQQAQLDDMLLEPQLGVVKEMIKQLETQPRATFRVL